MYIDKINQNKNPFCAAINSLKQNQPEAANNNKQEICSVTTSDAIKNTRLSTNKNYIFIQNINIPSLNLNGKLYMLPNGQKCLVAKKDGPCVIKTFFKVGSMNEPDNLRGISHFIEHNLFNGSENLKPTEFVKQVNTSGGNYNASTGFAATDYFIQSPLHKKEDLEKYIKIHADMLSKPLFLNEMIEKERGPVISEIQMLEDDPYNLATNTVLRNLFGIKSKSKDLIGGSVENIKNITRDDVVNYYHNNYSPKNAITVVIGDIDEDKTMNLLSQNFVDFKNEINAKQYNEEFSPIKESIRQDLYSPNTQANIIQVAFEGPKNNQDKTSINMLLTALAGYKNAKLTEAIKKLDTDITASQETISNNNNANSAIIFSVGTQKNNEEEILKTIYEKIHQMAYVPLTEQELNVVKNKMRTELKYAAESNMELASLLGTNYLNKNNFNSLINTEQNIEKTTAEDIMKAAKEFLNLNRASICVVHPEKAKNISFTGKLDKIKTYITPNNAEISIQNNPDSKLYAMDFEIKADIFPKKSPAALILCNMLSKGTSLMSEKEFANINDENNVRNKITASYNTIKFSHIFPKESLQIALDDFNQTLFNPILTQENFEKAKKEIKNTYLSNPKNAFDRGIEKLFEATPKSFSLRKICEDIDSITLEDITQYYKDIMKNPRLKVSITGNTDNEILNKVYSNISSSSQIYAKDLKTKALEPKELSQTQVIVEAQERNQADIIELFRIKETGNARDKAAILLLNEILGGNSNSRLFNDLREKQKLAYRVNSTYSSKDNDGLLALRIFTTTDNKDNPNQYQNMQKSINGFKEHIKKLVTEDVTQEELDAAKLQIKSKLSFKTESTSGKNEIINESMNSLYKQNYMESMLKAIDETTPTEIKKIAKYYLEKPSVISIIASEDSINKNKEYLNSLGEINKF